MSEEISSAGPESVFKLAIFRPSRLSVGPPKVGVRFVQQAKIEMRVCILGGCRAKILQMPQLGFLCGMTQELKVTHPSGRQRKTAWVMSPSSLPLLVCLLVTMSIFNVAETTNVEAGRVFLTDVTPIWNLFQSVYTQGGRGGNGCWCFEEARGWCELRTR